MATLAFHPKAFLTKRRNVKAGLQARSLIISCLEKGPKKTGEISREIGFTHTRVAYHLKSLIAESLVSSKGKRPYVWSITEYGQQRLAT